MRPVQVHKPAQGLQIDKLNERNCEEFLWVIAEQAKQHQVQYKQFTNMTHACWCSLAGMCRLLIRMRNLGSSDRSMSDARDGAYKHKKCKFMEHFKIVYVGCFYIQISINSSTIVLTSMFLGFQMRTFLLELNLNHCLLLLFVSCCMCSYYIFWKNMGFLKNYVANMGQIAKKLGKSSIYGAALKLCSLLVTLVNQCVLNTEDAVCWL